MYQCGNTNGGSVREYEYAGGTKLAQPRLGFKVHTDTKLSQ